MDASYAAMLMASFALFRHSVSKIRAIYFPNTKGVEADMSDATWSMRMHIDVCLL